MLRQMEISAMRALVYQGPSTFSYAADTRGLTVIIEI
jgi:hypothetical protein